MNRVKVNQVYVAPMMAGRTLRRLRILANHPDGGYLAEILYTASPIGSHEKLIRITDLSLQKAYRLEQDVCEHRHTSDLFKEVGDYAPAMPNYYKCDDCGDEFPNIGDTDLWFPKVIENEPIVR